MPFVHMPNKYQPNRYHFHGTTTNGRDLHFKF
uniref:Uncharacterized protein n=1 Tax=Arundo donax TaxID=35708 RepID=A0A0A9BJK3_ARUDO